MRRYAPAPIEAGRPPLGSTCQLPILIGCHSGALLLVGAHKRREAICHTSTTVRVVSPPEWSTTVPAVSTNRRM
jgi:hypothetical protein